MTRIRMDVWLWAAHFFKTRTLAKKSCDLGRILSNTQVAKAAREIHAGVAES
jgi:ribosome-associated heat shock protein Hsp15